MMQKGETPDGGNISVKTLSGSYLEDVFMIEQEAFQNPWSLKALRETGERKPIMMLGAYGEELAGYGIFQMLPPEAELLRIAVKGKYRHRGIARSILEEFLRMSRDIPVTRLMLEVDENNIEALKLYLDLGFVVEGRRGGYYEEGDSDAILMSLFPDLTGVSCGKTGMTTV